MSTQYTDIENTGLPAVPDLRREPNETQPQYEFLEEAVWSHRQGPRARRSRSQ